MRVQTAKLRNQLKRRGGGFEFEFLQGELQTKAHDPAVATRFGGKSFYSWYDVEHDGGDIEYGQALLDDSVTFTYPGARQAIKLLDARADGYDVLLGFSQGAILITMLTAFRLQQARAGLGPPPSWACNVLICGMPVRANDLVRELEVSSESPLDFPCVIAQGTKDPFLEWCRRLPDSYVAPKVVTYGEGHRFPHRAESTAEIADAVCESLARSTIVHVPL